MSADSQLQEDVLAELSWDPSLAATHIDVAAQDGVVRLTGHVRSYAEKRAAEAAAERVRGCVAVALDITVQLPAGTSRSDSEIQRAANDRLAWDVSLHGTAIAVTVDKGWLTLSGTTEQNYQRQAADDDVRRLFGVVGVTNRIVVSPKAKSAVPDVNAANISDDIVHALHRSWFFDPKTITVTSEGGTVRLSGTVKSAHDRGLAVETAWSAPGVTVVINDITIV
jgi:osmotically-inducible protein OsmY